MRARHRYGGGLSLFSIARHLTRKVNVGRNGVIANGKKCVLCKKCEIICPVGAIHVSKSRKQWQIKPGTCINCYRCIGTCPTDAIKIRP